MQDAENRVFLSLGIFPSLKRLKSKKIPLQ